MNSVKNRTLPSKYIPENFHAKISTAEQLDSSDEFSNMC